MKARVKWVEGVSFVGESGSGHAMVIDGAPEHGGRNVGMRPMELVLLGAAACTAFDVVLILRKARQPIADCVVDAEAARAAAEPKVFTRIHLKYHGRRPRPRPAPGRARGQAVEGQVLLGDADAREDRRDHLRDCDRRGRPAAGARHGVSAGTGCAVTAVAQHADQARRVPPPAAPCLHPRVELVDERRHRQRGAVGRAPRRGRAPGPCASSRRRSRNRTCRRAIVLPRFSICHDCAAPLLITSSTRSTSSPALAAKLMPSASAWTSPAMQIWLTILVSWPLPGPPISVTARA